MSRPVKVTPEVVERMHVLKEAGKSNQQIAGELGLSVSTVKKSRAGIHGNTFLHRGINLVEPSKREVHTSAPDQLRKPAMARVSCPAKKLAPEVSNTPEAVPSTPTQIETEKEDTMLLQNEALTLEARQHFNLPRSPFVDDVASPDDVYQTGNVRYVRAALLDCAVNHSLLAVVGESGAGKTTLAEDLEERIKADKRDVLVIRPYVLAMEANDQKGKTLKSSHIAEAIAYALDPQLKVKSSPQARFQQVHDLLKASRRAGRRHLLLIEEAHCLPLATLKHLKRFLELKDGMQRLIGVALIGQPELRDRMGSQNAEVREVMQRCEIVELEPLDGDLEGYLKHKFARFGLKVEDVMVPEATDAIRARLNYTPRGTNGSRGTGMRSMCFPLVVNNLVCRAMNAATKAGWDKVDAQVIASC